MCQSLGPKNKISEIDRMPLRKDDTHKPRSVNSCLNVPRQVLNVITGLFVDNAMNLVCPGNFQFVLLTSRWCCGNTETITKTKDGNHNTNWIMS